MTAAREYFDQGINHLGGNGAAGDQWSAREAFTRATEAEPGMCDAWMGLAVSGEVSASTLGGAYRALSTLHRETRRIGLSDSALAPTVHTPFLIDLYPHTPIGIALAYAAALIAEGNYDEAGLILDDINANDEPAQAQIHRFVGATLHFITRRWPDVLAWTARPRQTTPSSRRPPGCSKGSPRPGWDNSTRLWPPWTPSRRWPNKPCWIAKPPTPHTY